MTHCVVPTVPLTERRTYTMGEAAALVRLSVSTLYAERARGRLETIKLAGRRLITREALDAYMPRRRARPAEMIRLDDERPWSSSLQPSTRAVGRSPARRAR
jgi:excisionase family DNA binding protein